MTDDEDIASIVLEMKALELDDHEINFVMAFCRPDNGYNATAAYLEAYPTENYGTAKPAACRKMMVPRIRNAIDLYRRKRVMKNETLIAKVLSEMERMAFTTPMQQLLAIKPKYKGMGADGVAHYAGETLVFKSMDEVPDHVWNCIKSVKQSKYGVAVEFYDRARFMELLGRSLGMFTENLNVTEEPYESLVKRLARERAARELGSGQTA